MALTTAKYWGGRLITAKEEAKSKEVRREDDDDKDDENGDDIDGADAGARNRYYSGSIANKQQHSHFATSN